MHFIRKPDIVEAVCVVEKFDALEWPSWLFDAWTRDKGQAGCLERRNPHDHASTLVLWTWHNPAPVEWGSWIVRDRKGTLSVVSADDFERMYQRKD